VPDSRFHAISAWIAACDATLIGPFGATSANTERGLSQDLPAPGSPNSPRRASISPGCTNVRPAALGKPFGENSGLFAHHLPPWTHRPRERQNLSEPDCLSGDLALKAKRLLARRKFLERSTGGVWVFLPIAVKEIQPYSIKGWFFGRLVVRARNNLSLISQKRGLPGRSNGPHGVCNAC
jgi:hypothetical protein